MFGLGPLELALLAFVALVVFGPERLPHMARTAGRTIRDLREHSQRLRNDLESQIDLDLKADLDLDEYFSTDEDAQRR
ncbi:twin-arginine translocase TatA/TatE family subunit [Aeromicrobium choanae]|uniref:Twin arginine-targeting protein translocase TatB n=1 Tax=Aeromicrobium choanae TaxID=1736691 RepID=A0A1T4Z0M0_9ACTN|nr:twin-arginine translocase TatA/TatE family subunit [Aeromicrobium choanae]SKB07564.1 twin arginine-targeting protein translocase TatB [Aeromicrobium choanae]